MHVHVPKKHHIHKTDPVERLDMFVGYAENSKAYRVLVWDTGSLQVIESASCTFAEHTSPTIGSNARRAVEQSNSRATAESDEDEFWCEYLVMLPHASKQIPADTATEPQFELADVTEDQSGEQGDV